MESKPYPIPEPTELPIQAIVIFYKVLKGVEYDDRLWDKKHFARNMASAQDLIEICKDYEQAKRCIEDLSGKYESIQFSWTLETIVKNAHEWKNRRGKNNDKQSRQRFFDALAKQRAARPSANQRNVASAGEILESLGVIHFVRGNSGQEDGKPDSGHGEPGTGLRPDSVEEEKA
jgi:hypothetical protein